ncbi:hypothetical protein NM90_2211 [Neisseria meningitidis NM90]|nr:hypothetical protein NM90_2211 [Neisseria meningitidis NM90]
MFGSIDFAAQNRFGTFDSQHGNLLAQGFACAEQFLLHIGLCLSCNARRLGRSLFFGFFDNFGGTFFGVGNHFGNLITPFCQEFCNLFFSLLEIAFTTLGGSQAFGDFCGTLIQSFCNRRPHEFHGKPYQTEKDDDLSE